MGANENPAGINGANKKAMKKQKIIQSSKNTKKDMAIFPTHFFSEISLQILWFNGVSS